MGHEAYQHPVGAVKHFSIAHLCTSTGPCKCVISHPFLPERGVKSESLSSAGGSLKLIWLDDVWHFCCSCHGLMKVPTQGLFLSSTASPLFFQFNCQGNHRNMLSLFPSWVDSRPPKDRAITFRTIDCPCLGHVYSLSGPFCQRPNEKYKYLKMLRSFHERSEHSTKLNNETVTDASYYFFFFFLLLQTC